jgi:hypothetical protein
MSLGEYPHNFPGTLGSIAGRFGVDKPLGFGLPGLHKLLGFPVITNGSPQESDLLGRDRAMDELAGFHVRPLIVWAAARPYGSSAQRDRPPD